VGILLLIAEVILIPGITLFGLAGFGLIAYAIYSTYSTHGSDAGHIVLVSTLVITGIGLYFALRSGSWTRFSQKGTLKGRANELEHPVKEGDLGITLSQLRPMGTAIINNEKMPVESLGGELIAANEEIEVYKLSSSKIIVKKISN
jgi:membrane-bound ClpP family serine protease